jgi:prepilin-type N-terminal cleavage/methylation domain-containing protein
MNKKTTKKTIKKGFTLIELMIIIAIIGTMTTVGFVSLKSGQNQAKLKATQAEIATMIKLAQSYALQGKKQGAVVPEYYGLKFSVDGTGYIFCSSSDATDLNCSNSIETHLFGGEIVLSAGQGSLLWFDIPNGNCQLSSAGSLLLTLKLDSNEKSITVSPGGSITEN